MAYGLEWRVTRRWQYSLSYSKGIVSKHTVVCFFVSHTYVAARVAQRTRPIKFWVALCRNFLNADTFIAEICWPEDTFQIYLCCTYSSLPRLHMRSCSLPNYDTAKYCTSDWLLMFQHTLAIIHSVFVQRFDHYLWSSSVTSTGTSNATVIYI